MSKINKILILLFISWPVNNLHRLLNNMPVKMGYWYPFSPDCLEELQWHVHSICECICYLCIFYAIRMYNSQLRNRNISIDCAIDCLLIVQAIDLIHYIGWHRRSELILTLEALTYIYFSFKILKKHTHG